MHDIQGEAGVSIGSIYNHFGGKEGIARALYDQLRDRMAVLVDEAVVANQDTFGRGRALVRRLFELTEDDPEVIDFVLNARHREFLPEEPPICSSAPFVRMRDVVREGMDHGEIRSMDPLVASSCAYGPALRMISMRLDGLIKKPLPPYVDVVWDAAWRSIRA